MSINDNLGKHIIEFFYQLSFCYTRETDLTNVTWAVLNTIPEFKEDFAAYFLSKNIETSLDDIEVIREGIIEKNTGDIGRADLILEGADFKLIVENKLVHDKNYHFEEYKQNAPGCYYGLIANHAVALNLLGSEDWCIKTWEEFVNDFKNKDYVEYSSLFNAYIAYVREVCNLIELEKITMDKDVLYSLYNFNLLAENIIKTTNTENFRCEVNRKLNGFLQHSSGYYFKMILNNGEAFWPYFGIYYGEREWVSILVSLEYREGYNENSFYTVNKRIEEVSNKIPYAEKVGVYKEEYEITLYYKDETFEQLNQSETDEQKELMKNFFETACDLLADCLNA